MRRSMKAVMISIQPKWCTLIANGRKTIEVRKTRPKIYTPFKGYIYMTQGTYKDLGTYCDWIYENRMKVIGEFICDKVCEIEYRGNGYYCKNESVSVTNQVAAQSCLDFDDLFEYLGVDRRGYGWHISDLKIYDKPKELGEFYRPLKYDEDGVICGTKQEMSNIYEWDCETVFNKKYTECTLKDCPQLQKFYRLNRPPQSWCYVEEL